MNITRLNFAESLPFIRSTLQSAHYLSFDLEMSGLFTEELTTPSIIDSMQVRYEKQRQSVIKFIPLQFGLSAFRVQPAQKRIIVQPFNFYIFPLTHKDEVMKFSFHAGTMNFLTKNNFDFNKLFYEGVPYCSRQKMRNIAKEKKFADMKQELKRIKQTQSPTTLAFLNVHMPVVDQWIKSDRTSLEIPIEFIKVQTYMAFKDKVEELYLHQPFTFAFDKEDVIRRTKLIFTKCTAQEKQRNAPNLDCNPPSDKMFNEIVEQMVALRKPIIVHNGYLDLMHVYYRFFESLPPHWNTYRKEIHNLFPHIYDNKYLFNTSPTLLHTTPKRMTGLEECFTGMREIERKEIQQSQGKEQRGVRFEMGEEFKEYKLDDLACHEAGFDALMTGFSFLKGITHLKNDLELLADTQAFAFEQQLIRNRTPQGSIKVPFNFEEGGVDTYSQDTNPPFFFRSILNTPIPEQTLLDYFTGQFGSISFYWTTRDQTQFCIIFVDEQDQTKYIKYLQTRKFGAFSIDEISGIQLLILSKEQHEQSMQNFIKTELEEVQSAPK